MGEAWVNVEVGQVLAETNNGNGACLFVALSHQLDGQFSPLQLRQMAVDYLSAHRAEMEAELLSLGWEMMESGDIPFPLEENDLLIDVTLQTLTNPQIWGGSECIAALSLSLSREIRVYQEGGPTIIFPAGENPQLRILLRYPHGAADRRTHYESVLHWRPRHVPVQSSSMVDAACQSDGQNIACSATVTAEVSSIQQNPPERRRWSDSAMVLRPRTGEQVLNLRQEPQSEEEEFTNDGEGSTASARYRRCLICRRNIGRYVMLNCGAFPVCGTCIRTWYINIQGAPCPHCGNQVSGWSKVFNQN